MGKIKYCYIILHYKTLEDTMACVKSIEKNTKETYKIIIVDNYSNNGTLEQLNKQYKKNKNITIIANNKNLGFANGNNVGFLYAKKQFNPDFIVMCNSDTLLLSDDYCDKIQKTYNKENFAVLGPKIILKNNTINPIRTKFPSMKTIKKSLIYKKIELFALKTKILIPVYDFFKNTRDNKSKHTTENPELIYHDIILHGCFWVFSKKYIDMFDGIDNRTFLYREEELLYLRLIKNGLHNIYDPSITIFHKEDGSTSAINKNKIKKRLFIAKNQIKSLKVLLEEIEKNKRMLKDE